MYALPIPIHVANASRIHKPLPSLPPRPNLAQIKARPRINRDQQLLPQLPLLPIPRQLQQIDTRTRTRQPRLIIARISNTEPRTQTPEAQQRRPRRARHEFQHFPLILFRQFLHDLPEQLHAGVLGAVVADHIDAAVDGVSAKIGDIDAGGDGAADESLELELIEHAEPCWGDYGGEAAEEGGGLGVGLRGQAVASHVGDVDEAVGVCDGDV